MRHRRGSDDRRSYMNRKTTWIAGGAIMIALTGGTAIAATSGDTDDAALTGPALRQATESALEHAAGTVTETEVGDEGAAYGVEVRREDGTEVEISLDENFTVVDEEVDDDGLDDEGPDEGDDEGPDERDDD
jgi:hypothetical protein